MTQQIIMAVYSSVKLMQQQVRSLQKANLCGKAVVGDILNHHTFIILVNGIILWQQKVVQNMDIWLHMQGQRAHMDHLNNIHLIQCLLTGTLEDTKVLYKELAMVTLYRMTREILLCSVLASARLACGSHSIILAGKCL